MSRRDCGPCSLCCKAPSIDWPHEKPPLKKAAGVYCERHVPGKGCGIYATAPLSCRGFQCLWLMGYGPEEMRPDLLGGFFDACKATLELQFVADEIPTDQERLGIIRRFAKWWEDLYGDQLVVIPPGDAGT